MHNILFMIACVMFMFTSAYPQSPSALQNIESVFGPQPTATPRPDNRGADKIVTPEPIIGSAQFTQTTINNETQCACVPYYRCDANTRTIIADEVVDGYGVIDIRIDSQSSQSCEHYLEVCCFDNNDTVTTPTPTIVPPPPTTPPLVRSSGCGIRNVNGIDFQIIGNDVKPCKVQSFPYLLNLLLEQRS